MARQSPEPGFQVMLGGSIGQQHYHGACLPGEGVARPFTEGALWSTVTQPG
jgi:hypothetical protein